MNDPEPTDRTADLSGLTRGETRTGGSTNGGPAAPDDLPALAPPERPDEIGRLGPYRVLGLFGRGGMGVVFRAEDPRLKRQVALKVMLPALAADPAARARFVREARAQAAVEHEHVTPIFQADEAGGIPFIAMPLLKGMTLAAALKANPVPPLAEAVRIGREVAEGLAAAHDQGLVHRDIKPGNVWLEGKKLRVKVLDFGLARAAADPDAAPAAPVPAADAADLLTRTGGVAGTPAYMSPEQAAGRAVDFRTDLWGLGVVLYQMTTGRLPFPGETTAAVFAALATDTPRPPVEFAPGLPPALDALVRRLLAKDPAHRPASAEAVAEELHQIGLALAAGVRAIPVGTSPGPWEELADAVTESAVQPPPAKARPRRPVLLWSAGGLLVLAAAGLLAGQLFRTASMGTLVIESDDPAAEVVVRRDGTVVRDRTADRELALPAGEYTVELAAPRPGLTLSPDRVTVARDGRETVRIRVPRPAPKPKDKTPPKPTPPDFQEVHGADPAAFQAWANQLRGYRPAAVSVRGGTADVVFDAVALPDDREWHVTTTPVSREQAAFDDQVRQGFSPPIRCLHPLAPTYGLTEVWVRAQPSGWSSWRGPRAFMTTKLADAKAAGLVPTHLSAIRTPDGLVATVVLIRSPVRNWEADLDIGIDEVTRKVEECRGKGWWPRVLTANADPDRVRFAAVFAENVGKVAWDFQAALSPAEYEQELARRREKRYRPASVASYVADGQVRYAVVWKEVPEAGPKKP